MVVVGDVERGRISTGCAGLDDILGGGLDPNRIYLVEGRPGSGKTTIAMQFLLEGLRQGERVLYVAMSETKQELELVAKLSACRKFDLEPSLRQGLDASSADSRWHIGSRKARRQQGFDLALALAGDGLEEFGMVLFGQPLAEKHERGQGHGARGEQ